MNAKPKRIGIDARFYGPVGKGLGRYTKEVVDRILTLDKTNEYIIFLGEKNFSQFHPVNPRVKKVLARVRWYTLAEQIIMPALIKKEKIDLMHFPHFNVPWFCSTKFVVTIHDLILTKFPTPRATTLDPWLYKIKHKGYQLVISQAIKQAQQVITVSRFTKNDIIKKFKVNPEKIIIIHEGVANKLLIASTSSNDKKVIFKYNIKKPFLLYVGNAYPHKNLDGLVKVFAKIKEKNNNLQLVLVGKDDYFYRQIKKIAIGLKKVNKDIVFPGFVPDEELVSFYRCALAYIFPSFYEGFGLPPLEAMAQGCPVISSNQASLPEILGRAALYFNPYNQREMQEKIERIITDLDWRQKLIKTGYQQVKKYSWDKCAKEMLNVYKNVIFKDSNL
jgi:glycosyltransferase involved in cell wall biosynthesis